MNNKTITLSHGSGGKDSAELMEKVFAKHFSNDILDKMEDGAVLNVKESRIVTSTDSFVVTPIEFKGGDIGKLSICGTVNDILMMGAEPKYITCGFIIEEGLEIEVLDRIVESTAKMAREAGVQIVAGDTKVIDSCAGRGEGSQLNGGSELNSGSESNSGPGLFINTTGIGVLPEGRDISASNCKPGDAIMVSGNLGDHHACILSARMNIENDIKSDSAVLSDIPHILYENNIAISAMRDVTRGGLGTVLNEIADSSGVAIEISEDKIPVDAEVRGFCGIMGLDPLYMGNEGKMIAVVSGDSAEKALELVRSTKNGKDACIVGYVKEGEGVFSKTKIGGTRKIDLLYGEGLPRIC